MIGFFNYQSYDLLDGPLPKTVGKIHTEGLTTRDCKTAVTKATTLLEYRNDTDDSTEDNQRKHTLLLCTCSTLSF